MIVNPAYVKTGGSQAYAISYEFDMGLDEGVYFPQETGVPGEIISTKALSAFKHTVTIKTTSGDLIPSNTTVTADGMSSLYTIVFVMPQSDVVVTGVADDITIGPIS